MSRVASQGRAVPRRRQLGFAQVNAELAQAVADVGVVGVLREGKPPVVRTFNREKTVRLKRSQLGEDPGTLVAVDANGNEASATLP